MDGSRGGRFFKIRPHIINLVIRPQCNTLYENILEFKSIRVPGDSWLENYWRFTTGYTE